MGPYSKNLAGTDKFETGRAECVAVHPTTPNTMYLAAPGGLWKTIDAGANWARIQPTTMDQTGYGGGSALVFNSAGTLLFASDEHFRHRSRGVYRFNGTNWAGPYTLPITGDYIINHMKFLPNNDTIVFACTDRGLFRSTNTGATWTAISSASEEYENIVFISGTSGTICYAIGGNKVNASSPAKVFKESTDKGLTFTQVSSYTTAFSAWTNVYADACIGDQSTANKEIYILAVVSPAASSYQVFKFIKNTSTNATSCTPIYNFLEVNDPDRLAIAYTSNKKLFFGGVDVMGLDLTISPPARFSPSFVHTDQHDMVAVPSQSKVLAVGDGGICSIDQTTLAMTPLNNGLHISQVHGFSGASSNPNFFVTGEQDTKGFVFNYMGGANPTSTTLKTFGDREPSGALVDKFDNNRIFANIDSYGPPFLMSYDQGGSFIPSGDATHPNYGYFPLNSTSFEAGASVDNGKTNYGTPTFYQDPVRPDKLYFASGNLLQYDPLHKTFVTKLRMGVVYGNESSPLYNATFYSIILSMGISPQDKNGFYFTTMKFSGGNNGNGPTASQVFKYIGPNIDDCWMEHNEDKLNWARITPDLKAAPFSYTSLQEADIYEVNYTSCAISQNDKEKMWVGMNNVNALNAIAGVPVKVLMYNHGVWSNYSQGLNIDDHVLSMVAERGSNDGIYLSTLRGVYYRNATSGSWILYSNNLPKAAGQQMEINYTDNTVRVGTWGQGVWRSPLSCPSTTSTITRTTIVNTFEETKADIVSTAVIPAGNNITYRAGTKITLSPGFSVTGGAYFWGFIHGCDSPGSSFNAPLAADNTDLLEEAKESLKELQNEFSIFPNPNEGSFTLRFKQKSEEEHEEAGENEDAENDIYIFDVMGKVVLEKKQIFEDQITIDLSAYPKGLYMVRVVDEEGAVQTKKVVIQ